MSLHDKIIKLYPELSTYDFATGDITLRNNLDGDGEFIAKWEHPTLKQPTRAQLNAVKDK